MILIPLLIFRGKQVHFKYGLFSFLYTLDRIIAHVEHLAELHLTKSTEADNADLFYGLTRALDMNADKMMVELTFVKQLVYNATSSEGINITEGTMQMDYEYIEPLGRLVSETKNCKMISKQVL